MPRRFYEKNNFEGSLFSFTKTAVLAHFKIGGFVSFSKSAVLSHFQNRPFCLTFKIGGFGSFKIGCFVLPPNTLCPNLRITPDTSDTPPPNFHQSLPDELLVSTVIILPHPTTPFFSYPLSKTTQHTA